MASIAVEQGTAEWHALRISNVGSSESAVLVDPDSAKWGSPFQLRAIKEGKLEPEDLSENVRVVLGSCLESGIAEAAKRLYGVTLRKVRRYLTHPEVEGMAASLDYEELTEDAGWVPAEIKLVDRHVFAAEWKEDEELGLVPPAHYLIQVQHQLAVTGKPYARIYPLVGGSDLKRGTIPRHDKLVAMIESAVARFWGRLKSGEPEPVDYKADREAMQRIFLEFEKGEEDRTGDIELAALVEQYRDADKASKDINEFKELLKAQLFERCKDFETVRAPGAKISCRLVQAKPARMVEYKEQPARRDFRIYLAKESSDGRSTDE